MAIFSPTAHAFEFLPLKQFALEFRHFGRRGLRVVGEEFQREHTRELVAAAEHRHSAFPATGRLLRSTRPFSGNPRLAGRGASLPSPASPRMVDRMRFSAKRRFGISNAASSPKGYVYAWQIWKGRGFRSGQMRGSVHLRRGVVEIQELAQTRSQDAGRRAIDSAKRKLRAR